MLVAVVFYLVLFISYWIFFYLFTFSSSTEQAHINSLVQDCSISIANALGMLYKDYVYGRC